MKYFLTVLICISLSSTAISQDSSRLWSPESWKKLEPGFRVGLGIQKKFFTEFGISFQRYYYNPRHGFMVVAYYSSYEWMPASSEYSAVQGIKVGAELINNGTGGGIEVKYQFNSGKEDIVITPKYGFGVGFANLFYGYNFSTRKRPFPQSGKHQFSLVFNTNILFHHSGKNKDRK
jgi:hypothetical protein